MGDENPPPRQPLFVSTGMDLDLHPQLIREERTKKEIMIPFEVLNPNTPPIQRLKLGDHRQIFPKGVWLLCGGKTLKPKEELEEIAQDHELAYPLHLSVQESEKRLHLFRVSSAEMGVRDEDPIFSGTGQKSLLTFQRRSSRSRAVSSDPDRKHFAGR